MGFVDHQGSVRERERGIREKRGRSPGFGEREREKERKRERDKGIREEKGKR